MIDCDSFQFSDNGQVFRCDVGVLHFTPPELHKQRLCQVNRSANHDNFGLAVLIFHILFMGRHPFAGRYHGKGDMPIERAIREHRFAYSVDAARLQISPPPHVLEMAKLPEQLALMFERAFSRGADTPHARPSALEWVSALDQLEHTLQRCTPSPTHIFPRTIHRCPWCSIRNDGGPDFFPPPTAKLSNHIPLVSASAGPFDLSATWSQIQAVPSPQKLWVSVGFTPTALPTPAPCCCSPSRVRRRGRRSASPPACCGVFAARLRKARRFVGIPAHGDNFRNLVVFSVEQ